jgi:hypothetical protein
MERVSEGVAKRRDASRVPQMCPKCVRVFDGQTTTKCRFAGTLPKPSSGLEPETPLLTMEVFDRLKQLAQKAEARRAAEVVA